MNDELIINYSNFLSYNIINKDGNTKTGEKQRSNGEQRNKSNKTKESQKSGNREKISRMEQAKQRKK